MGNPKIFDERELCNRAAFTLLDFNEETILHTRETLTEIKNKHQRATPIQFVQKSVQQVIKDGGKIERDPSSNMIWFIAPGCLIIFPIRFACG